MPKEKDVMKGGPGDEDHNDDQNLDDQNQNENNDEGGDKKPVYVTQEELAEFKTRQDKILNMLEGLAKKPTEQPPEQPGKGKKIAGMTQEEFEQLFWDNPSAALEQFKSSIVSEIRAETGKSQGQQAFWNDFYSENEDLKGDSDLVQLVLNQNLNSLADLPVAEAKVKLADLTRQRILRYSGGKKPENGGKKVVVEGTSHRMPPKKQEEEPQPPKTLGELIRARKAMRRNGGKAVAT